MLRLDKNKIISFGESLFLSNDRYADMFEGLPASKAIVPIVTDKFGNLTTSSAVLIKYREKILLLTALHCIDKSDCCERSANFFDEGIGELSNVDWCFCEGFDFAFACLDNVDAKRIIEKKQYFELPSFQDISKASGTSRQYFLSVGYPVSRNKKIKQKKEIKREKVFLEQSIKKSSGDEIFCEYDRDNFFMPDGEKIKEAFHPLGMSGGALIHLNTVYDAAIEIKPNFMLAGIITKYRKDKQMLVSTNMFVIKNVIKSYFKG